MNCDLFSVKGCRIHLSEECQFLTYRCYFNPFFPIFHNFYISIVASSLGSFVIDWKISCGAGSQWLDNHNKNNSLWFLFLMCFTAVVVETVISIEIIYFNFIWNRCNHCCSLIYWNLRYVQPAVQKCMRMYVMYITSVVSFRGNVPLKFRKWMIKWMSMYCKGWGSKDVEIL